MAHKSIFGYLEDSAASDKLKVKRSMSRYEEWSEAILPADAEAEGPEGETSRRPLLAFGALAAVALGILVVRMFALQVVAGDENLALADGNRIRERVERAPRGMIYDRNKVVLARNQASFDVTAVPQLLPQDEQERRKEYERVAGMLGLPVDEVAKRAEVTCKVKTPGCLRSPIPQLIAAGVERDKALLIDQASGSLPGFALDVNPIRQYADDNLLSVFLGYTGRVSPEEVKANPTYGPTDLIGKLGLEKQYEEVLRGTNGGERTEVDATGRPVRVLASRDPVPGDNLVLSIDQALQRKMADALKAQMNRGNIKRGAGIAVNPKTGEVLAAVSLPTYDNNVFSRGISESSYRALVNDPGQPLFNKVLSGAYPSGSVIKPMTASAALQEKIVTANTIINDTGQLDVVNPYDNSIHYIYKGWETSGLGNVNLFSAIARSSDIYFYTIAGGFTNFTRYLGVEKLTDWYMKFGFGARTGVDMPSETKGRVPTPEWKKKFSGEPWYTGDTYNISVGQGDILISPIQMAMATAAVANGGSLLKPHFVSEVTDASGKTVKKFGAETIRQLPVSAENLALVRQGMRDVIQKPHGTACCFMEKEVPVPVAGKTGSAETDPNNKVLPHSWFTSFSPYNDPKIVTVVLFEKAGEGSQFAAPATRELLRWYYTEGAGASR
jgi:penicillin-binding protein 2